MNTLGAPGLVLERRRPRRAGIRVSLWLPPAFLFQGGIPSIIQRGAGAPRIFERVAMQVDACHGRALSNSPQPVSPSTTWDERAIPRPVHRCPSSCCDIVAGLTGSEWMAAMDDSVVRITKEIRRSAAEMQLDGTLKEIGNSSGVSERSMNIQPSVGIPERRPQGGGW